METQNIETQSRAQDHGAYNFFLYLLVFLSLIFVAIGEGSILFGFIDKFVSAKDLTLFNPFDQSVVKFGIAALFIASPIFFAISFLITKRIGKNLIPLESAIRKWLTYIVLFFAAATAIGDLITLVVNFLGGDFTASFLLKVFVIIMIAGGIFGYYFWDMRRTQVIASFNKVAMLVAIGSISVTFMAGFFIIDSPVVARQKNLDQQVISNLQSIDGSVQNYFSQSYQLPEKLDVLQQTTFMANLGNIKDVTYEIKNSTTYKLCATFMRSNMDDASSWAGPEWKHEAGNFCFERIVLKKADIAPINAK
jgi:hypothetical protein